LPCDGGALEANENRAADNTEVKTLKDSQLSGRQWNHALALAVQRFARGHSTAASPKLKRCSARLMPVHTNNAVTRSHTCAGW
jgi:hypothetical protein